MSSQPRWRTRRTSWPTRPAKRRTQSSGRPRGVPRGPWHGRSRHSMAPWTTRGPWTRTVGRRRPGRPQRQWPPRRRSGSRPRKRDGRPDPGHRPSANVSAQSLVGKLDAFQREHPWAGFPLAVVKKFGDDRGGYLAALIAYYGFFSLFPLLLVFVTGLFFVLAGNPALRGKIVNSALSQFPVIGQQIHG